MIVKKFNISKPKKYQQGGQDKTFWQNIGTITEFHKDNGDISRIIEIPAIGLDANIFPAEPKPQHSAPATRSPLDQAMPTLAIEEIPTINIDGEITAADLPF